MRVAVCGKRVGRATALVEGEHQLRAEQLPVRVHCDERLELPYDVAVAAGGEIGIQPLLERTQTQLVERRRLRLRGRVELAVHERLASPERKRLVQPGRGFGVRPFGA